MHPRKMSVSGCLETRIYFIYIYNIYRHVSYCMIIFGYHIDISIYLLFIVVVGVIVVGVPCCSLLLYSYLPFESLGQ